MALGFRRGRRRGLVAGAAAGAAVAHHRAKKQQGEVSQDDETAQEPAVSADDQYAQLEKIGELRDKGILTDTEFEAQKKQILGG